MNTSDNTMSSVLSQSRFIALLGVNPRTDSHSYRVAAYLQSQGYELFPITTLDDAVLGFTTHRSLQDVQGPVDILDVFLESQQTINITEDVKRLGVKSIWVEPGCSEQVKQACEATGVPVYTNHCIMKDHERLLAHVSL